MAEHGVPGSFGAGVGDSLPEIRRLWIERDRFPQRCSLFEGVDDRKVSSRACADELGVGMAPTLGAGPPVDLVRRGQLTEAHVVWRAPRLRCVALWPIASRTVEARVYLVTVVWRAVGLQLWLRAERARGYKDKERQPHIHSVSEVAGLDGTDDVFVAEEPICAKVGMVCRRRTRRRAHGIRSAMISWVSLGPSNLSDLKYLGQCARALAVGDSRMVDRLLRGFAAEIHTASEASGRGS